MNVKRHILEFIFDQEHRLNHRSTRSEVCAAFANLSEDVELHLEQLEREGLLRLLKDDSDTVVLADAFPPVKRLELRGGLDSRAFDHGDVPRQNTVGLDLRGVGVAMDGDLFAHVVGDDSMIDAGLSAGDVAILKVLPHARGDIVAVESAGSLVMRRYVHLAGIPHLLAENPSRPELTAAFEQNIQGVLWCLICLQPGSRGRTASPIKKVCYRNDEGAALASEFVTLLKPRIKKGPEMGSRQRPRPGKSGTSVALKQPPNSSSRKASKPKWPKPPVGLELNDEVSTHYGTKRNSTVLEKEPEKTLRPGTRGVLCQDPAELERLERLSRGVGISAPSAT